MKSLVINIKNLLKMFKIIKVKFKHLWMKNKIQLLKHLNQTKTINKFQVLIFNLLKQLKKSN